MSIVILYTHLSDIKSSLLGAQVFIYANTAHLFVIVMSIPEVQTFSKNRHILISTNQINIKKEANTGLVYTTSSITSTPSRDRAATPRVLSSIKYRLFSMLACSTAAWSGWSI
jgi:hypothetical protein